MIQVLQKAFKIIELLNPTDGISLGELSDSLNINKGTLCNILKSLTELGYVAKTRNGHYIIHPNFYNLALPYSNNNLLHKIAKRYSDMLAKGTKESGVVATLRENAIYIVAQSQFKRSLMINTEYEHLSLYHSVSGRILVSHLDDDQVQKLIAAHGYPGREWDNINDLQKLREVFAEVRRQGISIMANKREGIKAFAVPIFDTQKKICSSLGITVPGSRLEDGNEKTIIDVLMNVSEQLTQVNIKGNLTQSEWFNEKLDF